MKNPRNAAIVTGISCVKRTQYILRTLLCFSIPSNGKGKLNGSIEFCLYYTQCAATQSMLTQKISTRASTARYGRVVPPQADAKSLTGGRSGIRTK